MPRIDGLEVHAEFQSVVKCLLKKTINRLAQDSSIKRAHRLVNKTGLYPYSN